MPTPKEQCFIDALNAYKDAFPDKDPKVEMFKDWYREPDGTWHKAGFFRDLGHWIGSILKTRRILAGDDDPRPAGEPNPEQWRTPDMTASDGKVYDLKFTNAQGKVDDWRDQPGMGGGTQKEDYEAINKQADPTSGAMSLDKDSCKCDERGEPQPVQAIVPAQAGVMVPGVNPVLGGQPAPVEAPAPASGGFGLPEFAFP